MVYTKKSSALFIIGLAMLAIWYLVSVDILSTYIEHLGGEKYKYLSEIATLPLCFGIFSIVLGAWQWFGTHKEGLCDYYASTVAGAMFILLISMVVRWFVAPEIAVISKSMGKIGDTGKYLHTILGFNYVVLGILAGIIIVNFFKVPTWAENGVRLSRLGLKTGVILLGTLYSAAELKNLGGLSIIMIGFFVLGSVGLVLWLGGRMKIPNSMGGVLSAGMGVCGVSATVASAPVVQAKSVEIAYTIGTILLWGVVCMFVFPIVGHMLNLSHVQFGAWAGTGILNSAQVAGAALAYQPDGIETLKVAEIFNITRVLVLPIIVLWLAIWYVRHEDNAPSQVNAGKIIFEKFPVFVLGFIFLFALSTTEVFAPANHYKGKYFGNTVASGFEEKNLLKQDEVVLLKSEFAKVQRQNRKQALQKLIERGKVMSTDDDDTLRGLVNARILTKQANHILKNAHKSVRHTAKKVKAFRNWITWLFAFGLVGLGMQITVSAMRQAGGQPAIIGGIVGLAKAVLSLVVVVLLISETV
jgi:uncharacterized membrane protein YadS